MAATVTKEIRTDFTGDASDLAAAARSAGGALDDVNDELGDLADQAAVSDAAIERLADELATMVRRAERAEGKVRDLRRELKKLGDEDTDVDVNVDVDMDEEHVGRLRRQLQGLRKDLEGDSLAPTIFTGAIQSMTTFAQMLTRTPPMVLAVIGIVAALVAQIANIGIVAGISGAALGGLAYWLYGRDPTSPMAQAIDGVREKLSAVADTFANVMQPIMDDIAQVIAPHVIDVLNRLSDWIVNNRDQIQKWALDFAKAFLSGVVIAAQLGIAILKVTEVVLAFSMILAAMFETWGRALSILPGKAGEMGDAMLRAGGDARHAAFDMAVMAEEGVDGLEAIAGEANAARDELDTLGIPVTIKVDDTDAQGAIKRITKPETKKVTVEINEAFSGSSIIGWRPPGWTGSSITNNVTVHVNGGDPQRVVQAIRGATITAVPA